MQLLNDGCCDVLRFEDFNLSIHGRGIGWLFGYRVLRRGLKRLRVVGIDDQYRMTGVAGRCRHQIERSSRQRKEQDKNNNWKLPMKESYRGGVEISGR